MGERRRMPTRPASALPGATSRWNRGKDLSWEPLRAERVAEVAYDHLQGDRFRHATTFKRWRPDKPPADCRYDQLEETAPYLLATIFGGVSGGPTWRSLASVALTVARRSGRASPTSRHGPSRRCRAGFERRQRCLAR